MRKILGIYSKEVNHTVGVPLNNGCPKCASQLIPYILQEHFYLFFIPLFPIQNLDHYYRCHSCSAIFNTNYKLQFLMNAKIKEKKMREEDHTYARAVIASMTHMASIDKNFDPQEALLIENLIKTTYNKREKELKVIRDFVLKHGNLDNYVFDLLAKVKRDLSAEGLITVLVQSVEVLLADGKIHPTERRLLKNYLKVCGLPPRVYRSILDRAKHE